MKQEHTSLPWHFQQCGTGAGAHYSIRYNSPSGTKTIPDTEKNSAFIVRACNSHYSLVALLERFYDATYGNTGDIQKALCPLDFEQARNTLAKAKG